MSVDNLRRKTRVPDTNDVLQVVEDFSELDKESSGLVSLSGLQEFDGDYAIDHVIFDNLDKDRDGVISIADAVGQWYPNAPPKLLQRLFAPSLDAAVICNLRRAFCRLTDKDEADGILSLKRIAENDGKFLGLKVPIAEGRTKGFTLSELMSLFFPSLTPTIIQQYAGTTITEKRWRRMKAGFDAMLQDGECALPLQQLRMQRKPAHCNDQMVRWHNHLTIGGLRLDPSAFSRLPADHPTAITWTTFVQVMHPNIPRHRMNLYFKSYNIEHLDAIVPDSPEKLNKLKELVTRRGLPVTRLKKHPQYDAPPVKKMEKENLDDSVLRLTRKSKGMILREKSDWLLGEFDPLHQPKPLTEDQQEESVNRLYTESLENSALLRSTLEEKQTENEALLLHKLQISFESTDEMQDSVQRLYKADVLRRHQNLEALRDRCLYRAPKKQISPDIIRDSVEKLYRSDVIAKAQSKQQLQEKYTAGTLPTFTRMDATAVKNSAHRLHTSGR